MVSLVQALPPEVRAPAGRGVAAAPLGSGKGVEARIGQASLGAGVARRRSLELPEVGPGVQSIKAMQVRKSAQGTTFLYEWYAWITMTLRVLLYEAPKAFLTPIFLAIFISISGVCTCCIQTFFGDVQQFQRRLFQMGQSNRETEY